MRNPNQTRPPAAGVATLGQKAAADATRQTRMPASKPVEAPKSKTTPDKSLPADLMKFKECAKDASASVKTVERWVADGYLTEWRPHPKSRTRRIARQVWEAFKQRFKKQVVK